MRHNREKEALIQREWLCRCHEQKYKKAFGFETVLGIVGNVLDAFGSGESGDLDSGSNISW